MKQLYTLFLVLSLLLPLRAQQNITILHLNDTHSTLSDQGPRSDDLKGSQGGIARAASVIALTKLLTPNTLVLHAGDVSVGDLFYNVYFAAAEFQLLNGIGIDAMTLGNHEFDLTPEALKGALQASFAPGAGFPLLSANASLSDPSLAPLRHYVVPNVIKTFGNVKVGIFGLTTPETNLISNPSPAVFNENIIEIAAGETAKLKSEGCQAVILLSHLGLDLDKLLAANLDGVDIIIGGHDHYILQQPEQVTSPSGKPVYILQAGSNYLYIGKLSIKVYPGHVELLDYKLTPLNRLIPELPQIASVVNELKTGIENIYGPVFSQQFGNARSFFESVDLTPAAPGVHDTPAGNLTADALFYKTGADIAIEPGGSIALPLYKGPLTGADIFRVNGYGFNMDNGLGFRIVQFKITGAQLIAGIEFCLSNIEVNDEYILQTAGMNYTFNSQNPPFERFTGALVNGIPFDPLKTYTVASNEFVIAVMDLLGIQYTDLQILEGYSEFQLLSEYIMGLPQPVYPKTEGRVVNLYQTSPAKIKGNGYILAPRGSSFQNPGTAGVLSFDMNINFSDNVNSTGSLSISYPKADILLNSDNFNWIAKDAGTVQIQGSGLLNTGKSADYLLMVTSENGLISDDKMHLIIKDAVSGEYIFDNLGYQNILGGRIKVKEVSQLMAAAKTSPASDYLLEQNYPNPFNAQTRINFAVPEYSHVSIIIYDLLGAEIASVADNYFEPGSYSYIWNASSIPSGIYFCRLSAGNKNFTKKLVIVK